jgi:alcohol dehydrogenase class IV
MVRQNCIAHSVHMSNREFTTLYHVGSGLGNSMMMPVSFQFNKKALLHWQGKVKSTLHRQESMFRYFGLPLPKHLNIVVCTFCAFRITTLTTPYCLR